MRPGPANDQQPMQRVITDEIARSCIEFGERVADKVKLARGCHAPSCLGW